MIRPVWLLLKYECCEGCGGLRPSFSAHVRWCEHGALQSCGERCWREGKAYGIPHLAKNERDVGHPAVGAGLEPQKACCGGICGLRLRRLDTTNKRESGELPFG
jgi:hypothetical protein